MLHTRTQNEFGVWGIPGRKPQIAYAMSVMARLAAEAVEAGSKPIGGVLFGTSSDQDIRITACRPIDCLAEEAGGSPFSSDGEQALGRLAESYGSDQELVGLQPVGWYRSRWESSISLNQEDLRVWNRFFPLPSQISLVMRVQKDSPVRAGFFFRPQLGGPVRIDSSYRTFEIAPSASETPADMARLATAMESGRGKEPAAVKPEEIADMLEPPPALFTPPESRRRRGPGFLAGVGLAALALLAAAMFAWWPGRVAAESAVTEVGLRFTGPPNRLQVTWNPRAAVVSAAGRAELRLIDGDSNSQLAIAGSELQLGAKLVPNRSGQVEAQLRLFAKNATSESSTVVAAQYVGRPAGEARVGAEKLGPLRLELARLAETVRGQVNSNGKLEERIRKLREQRLRLTRDEKAAAPAAAASAPPLIPVESGAAASSAAQARPPAATPPATEPSSPARPGAAAGGTPVLQADPGPSFGTDRTPARVPAALPDVQAASAPSYTGPTSGKFIWTGYLAPGKTVTIDGRRASSGSVNGSLPGVPVRVSVYPAEFSSSGLSVFSASPRHQAGAVSEGRSAQNGWNNTKYVYDPARARDAQISASPGEAGGYKQMQISGGERPVSVVVVEWAVAR